ncbi:ankyrin repeat protein [Seiridium cupressi]
MSFSPYKRFRSPPLCDFPEGMENFGKLVYEDGSTFYETENGSLLLNIIELDDVAALSRYLEFNSTRNVLGPKDSPLDDPFWTAAAYGSTGALQLLLEHWDAAGYSTRAEIPAPNRRGYGLLQTACESAHVETTEPQKSTAPIGSKAISLLLRKVMQLLLDEGANVQDQITRLHQLHDTVLSLAICRAGPPLIRRLIEHGADFNATTTQDFSEVGSVGLPPSNNSSDVTPLHIGSLYSNVGGLQVLLNYSHGIGSVNMVRQTDTLGRLPLHFASWGPSDELCNLDSDEDGYVPRVTATIETLLEADPSTVNIQDKNGHTALHYVVWRHSRYRSRHIAIVRALCNYGADAGLQGRDGKTPLHGLGFRFRDSEPVDTSFIDLLLEHNVGVNDIDRDGNTALHFAAKNLIHSEAARHLVSRGADVSITNHQGNTPLHEAAGGIWFTLRYSGKFKLNPSVEDLEEAQNEMIGALLSRLLEENADRLMNQPNAANSTPRQICQQRRKEWRELEESRREQAAGRSKKRGFIKKSLKR